MNPIKTKININHLIILLPYWIHLQNKWKIKKIKIIIKNILINHNFKTRVKKINSNSNKIIKIKNCLMMMKMKMMMKLKRMKKIGIILMKIMKMMSKILTKYNFKNV